MTTTDNNFNPPQPPLPAHSYPVQSQRGAAAIIVGTVLVGSGFLTAISGGVMIGLFGDGRAITSAPHTISTSHSAVVSDIGHLDNLRGWEFLTGSPTLHISAENVTDSPVFIGVGRADDVERYLDNVAIDRVVDLELSPFNLRTRTDNGPAPAMAPGTQSFWVASAQSFDKAELSWALAEGDYEIVLMNADGSAGVITSTEIGASLPSSTGLWILVTVIGLLIMVGGAVAIGAGTRRGTVSP